MELEGGCGDISSYKFELAPESYSRFILLPCSLLSDLSPSPLCSPQSLLSLSPPSLLSSPLSPLACPSSYLHKRYSNIEMAVVAHEVLKSITSLSAAQG